MLPLTSTRSGATAHGLKVDCVDDRVTFERMRSEWDELLEDSAQQVYFLRHCWNVLWWRECAPRGGRLHVLRCRDESGRLVGIAPLYWHQHQIFGIPYARELAFIGMGIELKSSEYMDIFARRGHEKRVSTAFAEHLRTNQNWERICLQQVPSESTLLSHFIHALSPFATPVELDRAPYIDTSIEWADYKQLLGRSMRRNVEYYARRLFKNYHCEFLRVAAPHEVDEAVAALIELHQQRWRSTGQPGAFSDTALSALMTGAAHDGIRNGRTRLWSLRIDGRIEAVLLGFLDNGVLHYFQKGFNPAFAKDDLGTAILSLCIRDCFADPAIRQFDFMGGGAPYKDLWARNARTTLSYALTRENLRSRVFAAREQLLHASKAAFRALTPATLRQARREFLNSRRMKRLVSSHRERLLTFLVPATCSLVEAMMPLLEATLCLDPMLA
jgi:CelD/BcsL family acetyltransferase involved in cellulose biosynthesis